MEPELRKPATDRPTQPVSKLYLENTLLRVAGALFCHDAKRAHGSVARIELNKGVADKALTIEPNQDLGRPGPLAHRLFIAIMKKHSDYGRPVQSEVSFSRREIMRLAGRSTWGGRDSAEFTEALQQIHRTFITASFKDSAGRFIEESFNICPRVILARKSSATDPVEACVVTLADPIVASLKDDHFTCLNYTRMQRLGTIAQALMMRLFSHYANLYDGDHPQRLRFEKRYDAICGEWLGGLRVHAKRSLIEREQLGTHLRQLVTEGFLASYAIERMSSASAGFKVTFRPGRGFFQDYDRFYRHRMQGELQRDFHGDRRDVGEPIKLAHLFIEKRNGKPLNGAIPYVISKDVSAARELLNAFSVEEACAFIDYALAEAEKTRFDVKTLSGLRQYLAGYEEHRRHRAANQAANAARASRERRETLRAEYDRFRNVQADAVFQALPAVEQAAIEAIARGKTTSVTNGTGSLGAILLAASRARTTADRHPDKIQSFDAWLASAAASMPER